MAEAKRCRGCAWRAAAAALLALLASPAAGLDVNGYSDADNNRFASGYPNNPVPNTSPSFIGAGYDWSGVGWNAANSNQSFALLGPNSVLIANHYPPDLTKSPVIDFLSSSGTLSDPVVDEPGSHTYPWVK